MASRQYGTKCGRMHQGKKGFEDGGPHLDPFTRKGTRKVILDSAISFKKISSHEDVG